MTRLLAITSVTLALWASISPAHAALDVAAEKIDKQLRRYKRRINDRHEQTAYAMRQEEAAYTVFVEPEPEAEPAPAAAADDDWEMPELTPPDAPEAAEGGEPLELELEAEGASEGGSDEGGDELLLDASRLADEDAPVGGGALPGRRRGLVASSDETADAGGDGDEPAAPAAPAGGGTAAPAPAAPRPGAGATLFERMANLSRGGARSSDDEDEDDDGPSISIPRFLGRQNNQ